ncbi:MAG: protein-tyrosine phosphatase family protein [Sulfitobacter sp.]
MPCPTHEQDIQRLGHAGITTALSMLPSAEAADLAMAQEGQFCANYGLTFRNYPIPDFGLPDPQPFAALIEELVADLQQDAKIAVHCRAGIGRSGMVCSCILIALGYSAARAKSIVSDARSVSIPDTVEQDTFINDFAKP